MASNFLDRTIGFFSPERGAKRVAARKRMEVLDGVRGYEGASTGRLAQGWRTTSGDANSEIAKAGQILRDRSRDAVRNNPLATKIVTTHANNLIGFGITPQFKTGKPDVDKELMELFDEWSKVCFVDGSTDAHGVSYLMGRLMVQDGEGYLRKRTRRLSDGLPVPLQLQVLTSEFCDWSKNGVVEGNQIINGIEFDQIGRRRGYWMFPQNPKASFTLVGSGRTSSFVPASDIAHVFEQQDSQIHGVTWLAPVLTELKDLRDYELAENIRKKIEACAVGTVIPGDGDNADDPNVGIEEGAAQGIGGGDQVGVFDAYGNPLERMEPGMFAILRGGKDIKFNTPAISAGMESYIRTRHRSIAAGARITYELLTGDYSQANFASGKLGILEHQRFNSHIQWHVLIPQMMERIAEWFIEAAKLAGKIPMDLKVKVEWTPPEVESITRLDDARADLLEVRMGKRSMQEVIAKTGREPDAVLKEQDEWNAKVDATTTKVVLDSDPRKVSINGQAQGDAEGDDSSEGTRTVKMFRRASGELTEVEIRIPNKTYTEVEVRADTLNEEDRSVEVCWTTGARVKRYSWDEGYYMEELAVDKKAIRLDRFNAMSLLDSHDNYSMDSRLGTVIPGSVRIEGGKAYARIKFSKKQRAEEIMQDVRDGHPLPISVGYKIHRYEKTEASDGQLPVLRATDWEPMELSAVPIPADSGAISRSEPDGKDIQTVLVRQEASNAASPATTKERPMNKREAAKKYTGDQLDALAIGAGLSRSEGETDDALRVRLLAAYDKEDRAAEEAESARKAAETEAARKAVEEETQRRAQDGQHGQKPQNGMTPQQVEEEKRKAVAGEVQRRADIEAFAKTAGLKLEDELVRKAINESHTMDQFRNAVLDNMVSRQAQTPTFPHADHSRLDAQDTMRSAVANALLHRADPENHKLSEEAREWRGMSLLQLQREMMGFRGEKTRGLSDMQIAERAFHTTSDFPVILANVVRTTLLQGYETFPNTFELIAKRRTVSNFKEIRAVRFGENPELKKVNEHGEFPRGTMVEGSESYKIATYGRVIGMTRQMLINDELGAFAQVPNRWGRQVAKLEGDIVWGMIVNNAKMSSDSKTLFHADHKNLGTAAALSIDSLGVARTSFRKQTDIDGVRADIAPKYLFVPTDLEITAEKILTSVTPAQTSQVVPKSIQSLIPVSEYRLDKLSATVWFLFAGKEDVDAGLEYAYLEGNESPYTEERIGFDVDGVEYKVRHDFGAGLTDFRFGYMNAGQ